MAELLKNVTIADFSQMGQGGIATQKLGDMGADVIKIEPPRGEYLLRVCPSGHQYCIERLLTGFRNDSRWVGANLDRRLGTDRGTLLRCLF